MKYGRNRVEVENEIRKWSESTESVGNSSGGSEDFPEPMI